MIRLLLILLLGIFIIPHAQAETTESMDDRWTMMDQTGEEFTFYTSLTTVRGSTESAAQTIHTTTDKSIELQSTSTMPNPNEGTTEKNVSSDNTLVTSESLITFYGTTEGPIELFFYCDFSTNCFGKDQIVITTGNEFNPTDSETPPRAPSSDASSTYLPTDNGENCTLPYEITFSDNSTSSKWEMWFCFNNECPTSNGTYQKCDSGLYGLITMNGSETERIVSNDFTIPSSIRDANRPQCVRFRYFLTSDEQLNWNQRIEVSVDSKSQPIQNILVGTLTTVNTTSHKWNDAEFQFNSPSNPYTLSFAFKISSDPSVENETIYFALDDIRMYDVPCSTGQITTSPTPATRTTTLGSSSTDPPGTNLGLILGLSLGIGIPVLLLLVGIIVFSTKRRSAQNHDSAEIALKPLSDSYSSVDVTMF